MSLRFNLIKDIDGFKNDALMGLTPKEVGCCGLAILAGGCIFYFTNGYLGEDIASILCLIAASPFAITALFKKNGMSFIEYIKAYYNLKVNNPTLYFASYDSDLLNVTKVVDDTRKMSKKKENKNGK